MSFEVLLANTRGMCAGVERAILVVEKALAKYGNQKVYVLHDVVHNKHVVNDLASRGARFIEDMDEIDHPQDKVLIFSAHGVGLDTINKAQSLGCTIIDATCPLVRRVHFKVGKAASENKEVVIIGHEGHQEVIGTIGQYANDKSKVHLILTVEDVDNLQLQSEQAIFATQTTLSVDETAKTVQALKEKYPFIEGPKTDDTCFATQYRQAAVKELAKECDLVIVAGSQHSSNSKRLSEVAKQCGVESVLIDDYTCLDHSLLQGVKRVGITAGASVPEHVVQDLIKHLQENGASKVKNVGPEQIHRTFPLPEGLD